MIKPNSFKKEEDFKDVPTFPDYRLFEQFDPEGNILHFNTVCYTTGMVDNKVVAFGFMIYDAYEKGVNEDGFTACKDRFLKKCIMAMEHSIPMSEEVRDKYQTPNGDPIQVIIGQVDIPILREKSRCCGRCDGHNDICVTDRTCEMHNEQGCEICWPHPTQS